MRTRNVGLHIKHKTSLRHEPECQDIVVLHKGDSPVVAIWYLVRQGQESACDLDRAKGSFVSGCEQFLVFSS
jgi:hypothetical protein